MMSQGLSPSNPVDILQDLDSYLAYVTEVNEYESTGSSSPQADEEADLGDACTECRVSTTPLILAATSGHKGCLKEMLSAGDSSKLTSTLSDNGATVAHITARRADLDCLKVLVAADKSLCRTGDIRGATPLHVCAYHGYVDCLDCLIDNGGLADQRDHDGATPIHFAASSGHLKCLRVLLQKGKGNPDMQTLSGETPVYYAAQEGHLNCVHWLVDQCRADSQLASNDGMTPLHAAAQTGRLNVTHWLVRSAGCQITSRTVDGATPVHFAAAKGHVAILEWMLHHCLATGLEQDDYGATPVHDAAEQGQLECLHVFYNHSVTLDSKDCEGLTPLDLALEKQYQPCAHFLRNPKKAFFDAKKVSREDKNAELRMLLSDEPMSSGNISKTKRRKTFGSFLSKSKKKTGSTSYSRGK